MFLHLVSFVRRCCTLEIKGWAEGRPCHITVASKPSHRALSVSKKGCEDLMLQSELYCPLPARSKKTPVSELILRTAAGTASELYYRVVYRRVAFE